MPTPSTRRVNHVRLAECTYHGLPEVDPLSPWLQPVGGRVGWTPRARTGCPPGPELGRRP